MKEFFNELLSIEEHKKSILVWAFIFTLILGLYKAFRTGDVPNNLLFLIQFLGGTVAGVNIANSFNKQNNNIPKI